MGKPYESQQLFDEYPAEGIEPITVQPIMHCTDLGNARRFVQLNKDSVRYVPDRQQWLYWNGQYWEHDTTGEIMRRAKRTAEAIYLEGCRKGGDVGQKLKAFALQSESNKSLKAMIEVAKSEPDIVVRGDDLDRDQFLFNVQNGTIDLKTGILRNHNRHDLITKISPVNMPVAEEGDCPTFKRFIKDIFGNDDELIKFLQKVIGYFLTGSTREQKFFYCYGVGANGKSTLLNVLASILGPYSKTVPSEMFMTRDNKGGATPELAQLPGVRLVLSNEVGENRRMDEPLVKSLTGGDIISARQLYKSNFEFTPAFKPVMAGNHKPEIRGTDTGIWRRMVLIPFTVCIHPEQQDRKLPEKLETELPEILRWAVQGCVQWQRDGLSIPHAVEAATDEYRSDMDIIGNWLDESCATEPGYETQSSKLYESYKQWVYENGFKPVSQRKLSDSLKQRGFKRIRKRESYFQGLCLLNAHFT